MQGEFRGDFSRDTFDPLKHFRRVFMQQGRVQLDADWNEQTSILLHYLRTLAADLIGPHGGPMDSNSGVAGFFIGPVPFTLPVLNDFRIGLGRYYVDGILCEADSTPIAISKVSVKNNNLSADVQVDHWTLDGIPFQNNQYVEVFDDVQLPNVSPAFSPTVVQITNPQQTKLTLTLQGNLTGLSNTTNPKLRRVITYLTQPDYPVPDTEQLNQSTSYQVYLDVWERHITYVEDDSIREVALGGPDTASRAKVVWQVRVTKPCVGFTLNETLPCCTPVELAGKFQPDNRGRLKAKARQNVTPADDPCIISPESRYRGAENQLYRVEIHRGGNAWDGTTDKDGNPANAGTAATFKWSRENGCVVFPIVSLSTGSGTTTVVVENLGRDDRFGLKKDEWVEVQDDDSLLQDRAATLLQVQSLDPTMLTVTLNGTADPNVVKNANQGLTKHPLVRRWDHRAGDPAEGGLQPANDGAALIQETTGDTWLDLEDGIQIQFQPSDNQPSQYRTGDYWLIPARTATGDVEWPTEKDSQGKCDSDRQAAGWYRTSLRSTCGHHG